jgi:hypothetical protein
MALTIKKFDANTRLVILPLFLSFFGYLVIGTVAEPRILEPRQNFNRKFTCDIIYKYK